MHDQSTTPSLFEDNRTKVCRGCKFSLPIEHFARVSQFSKYRRARCRPCIVKQSAAWMASDRGKRVYSNARFLRLYGITVEQYDELFKVQGGVCAICKKPESTKRRRRDDSRMLSVDHCHKTGKVRGLLCHGCNAGIALFREDPEALRRAAQFLRNQEG